MNFELNNSDLNTLGVKYENSERVQISLDKEVVNYIREVRDTGPSNKLVTNSTVVFTMIMLYDESYEDNLSRSERGTDMILSNEYNIDIATIDELSVDESLPESNTKDSIDIWLPESLVDELSRYKSEYIEDAVRSYYNLVWSDRAERMCFKSELLQILEADGKIDAVDVSEKTKYIIENFGEVSEIVESEKEWYIGLSHSEIEERIMAETKNKSSDRIPPLQYMFEQRVANFKEEMNSNPDKNWFNVDNHIENIVCEDDYVEYVEDLFDCSTATAEKYVDKLDLYWESGKWQSQLIVDNLEKFVDDFVSIKEKEVQNRDVDVTSEMVINGSKEEFIVKHIENHGGELIYKNVMLTLDELGDIEIEQT